jgi:hypothetical protein
MEYLLLKIDLNKSENCYSFRVHLFNHLDLLFFGVCPSIRKSKAKTIKIKYSDQCVIYCPTTNYFSLVKTLFCSLTQKNKKNTIATNDDLSVIKKIIFFACYFSDDFNHQNLSQRVCMYDERHTCSFSSSSISCTHDIGTCPCIYRTK